MNAHTHTPAYIIYISPKIAQNEEKRGLFKVIALSFNNKTLPEKNTEPQAQGRGAVRGSAGVAG